MPRDPNSLLTTSEIARLPAKPVSVATVSNWRRRYGEGPGDRAFPEEVWVEGSSRPRFRYGEVLAWLKRNKPRLGPFDNSESGEVLALPGPGQAIGMIEQLLKGADGGKAVPPLLLAQVVGDLLAHQLRSPRELNAMEEGLPLEVRDVLHQVREEYRPVKPKLSEVIESFCGDAPDDRAEELFETALSWGRPSWASRSSTGSIAELVAALSAAFLTNPRDLVLDPAVGEASFFQAIAGRSRREGRSGPQFLGVDIDPQVLVLAWQRSVIDRFDAQFELGDSLAGEAVPAARQFPLVVCNPVVERAPRKAAKGAKPAYAVGQPGREMAWAGVCQEHLEPGGRALLVVPRSALVGRGSEMSARRELLQTGFLEAVIGLPPGVLEHSRGPSALLVIAGPDPLRPSRGRILFVNLQDEPASAFSRNLIAGVCDALDRWRTTGTPPDGAIDRKAHIVSHEEVIGPGHRRESSYSLLPGEWVPEVVDEEARARVRRQLKEGPTRLGRALDEAAAAVRQLPDTDQGPARGPGARWIKLRELIDTGVVEKLRPVPQSSLRSGPPGAVTDGDMNGTEWTPAWQVDPSARRPVARRQGDTDGIPHDPGLATDRYLTREGDVIINPIAGAAYGGLKAEVDNKGGRLITHPLQGLRVGINHTHELPPLVLRAALEAQRNQARLAGRGAGPKANTGRIRVQELEVPMFGREDAEAVAQALRQVDALRQAGYDIIDASAGMADGLLELPGEPQDNE